MWLTEVVGELERERAMRVYVFPKLKKDGKLTDTEAQLRMERLSAAIELINELRAAGVLQTDQLALRLLPTPPLNTSGRQGPLNTIIKGAE